MNTKYSLDQAIFYLKDNEVHSAKILSICCISNVTEPSDISSIDDLITLQVFGESSIRYSTVHGVFNECSVFSNKQLLLDSM